MTIFGRTIGLQLVCIILLSAFLVFSGFRLFVLESELKSAHFSLSYKSFVYSKQRMVLAQFLRSNRADKALELLYTTFEWDLSRERTGEPLSLGQQCELNEYVIKNVLQIDVAGADPLPSDSGVKKASKALAPLCPNTRTPD